MSDWVDLFRQHRNFLVQLSSLTKNSSRQTRQPQSKAVKFVFLNRNLEWWEVVILTPNSQPVQDLKSDRCWLLSQIKQTKKLHTMSIAEWTTFRERIVSIVIILVKHSNSISGLWPISFRCYPRILFLSLISTVYKVFNKSHDKNAHKGK